MLKIIIADDQETVRSLLIRMLNRSNLDAEIHEVDDGIPLVEKIKENRYDLVLTDNSMKEMDGLEAIRKIREFNPEIPIYMVSADEHIKQDALNYGANGFIYKMDGPKKIIDNLRKIIG